MSGVSNGGNVLRRVKPAVTDARGSRRAGASTRTVWHGCPRDGHGAMRRTQSGKAFTRIRAAR